RRTGTPAAAPPGTASAASATAPPAAGRAWPRRRSAGCDRDTAPSTGRDPWGRTARGRTGPRAAYSISRRDLLDLQGVEAGRHPGRRDDAFGDEGIGQDHAQHLLELLHVLGVVVAVIQQEAHR